ncbi:oxidoreductase [Microvirga terrae]|uniref:Oxidoreductase n=1 Tax=Microvirga terrae TaxID=2740529 RepID=A0ABY5RT72_9HYPH|nr:MULTISPECIES: oxidoreductase [Microvirga]UVF18997.1 oxidoreductase [Microvirga terrae]
MTFQTPLNSGFGPSTTAIEVVAGRDLSGKVAIVTGGYAGIGLETVRALVSAGASVIVPARDPDRARQALTDMPGTSLEVLDLMEPGSIDAFADRFLASGKALHILVNNAGIMANPLARDGRGYESQLSTNHLGHFQLTVRLAPALRRAEGARVVAVSSRGHWISGIDLDDPNFDRRAYDPWIAYGQSKTANILFALMLDRLGESDGIRAFSLHPGAILTNLSRHMTREQIQAQGALDEDGSPIIDPARGIKNAQQGAATSVWCATSSQLQGLGGVYCEDCDVAIVASDNLEEPRGVRPWAIDPDMASQLWALSEHLTGHVWRSNSVRV